MESPHKPALFELVTDAVTAWRDTSAAGALEHDFGERVRLAATYERAPGMAGQLIHDRDEARRHVGYRLFAAIAESQPVHRERIAKLLGEELPRLTDEPLRIAAIDAIGRTRRPEVVAVLLRAATVTPENEVGARVAIVRAVTECTAEGYSSQAVAYLVRAMDDPVPAVREWATYGLGMRLNVDSRSLRDAIARRLFDEDEHARLEAVRGLARRRDGRAMAAVEAAMSGEKYPDEILEAAMYLAGPALWNLVQTVETQNDSLFERFRMLCDPKVRARQDERTSQFLEALGRHPDASHVAVVCQRFTSGMCVIELATGGSLDLASMLEENENVSPDDLVQRVFELL